MVRCGNPTRGDTAASVARQRIDGWNALATVCGCTGAQAALGRRNNVVWYPPQAGMGLPRGVVIQFEQQITLLAGTRPEFGGRGDATGSMAPAGSRGRMVHL